MLIRTNNTIFMIMLIGGVMILMGITSLASTTITVMMMISSSWFIPGRIAFSPFGLRELVQFMGAAKGKEPSSFLHTKA